MTVSNEGPTASDFAAAAKLPDCGAHCEHIHGDQADPEQVEIDNLRNEVVRLKGQVQRLTERRFPIMDGPSIPWRLLAPHESQAKSNHDQDLETLARRGGLSPCEALAVLEDRKWRRMDPEIAKDLLAAFNEWVSPEAHGAAVAQLDGAIAEAAAAKRERNALRAELDSETVHWTATAIESERDACAKAAYDHVEDWTCPGCDHDTGNDLAAEVEQAILTRGGGDPRQSQPTETSKQTTTEREQSPIGAAIKRGGA